MRTLSIAVLCLAILLPQSSSALFSFGPDNFDACIAGYANKARSRNGSVLLRRACECKFKSSEYACTSLDSDMCDCILDDMPDAQTEQDAWAVYLKCKKEQEEKKKTAN